VDHPGRSERSEPCRRLRPPGLRAHAHRIPERGCEAGSGAAREAPAPGHRAIWMVRRCARGSVRPRAWAGPGTRTHHWRGPQALHRGLPHRSTSRPSVDVPRRQKRTPLKKQGNGRGRPLPPGGREGDRGVGGRSSGSSRSIGTQRTVPAPAASGLASPCPSHSRKGCEAGSGAAREAPAPGHRAIWMVGRCARGSVRPRAWAGPGTRMHQWRGPQALHRGLPHRSTSRPFVDVPKRQKRTPLKKQGNGRGRPLPPGGREGDRGVGGRSSGSSRSIATRRTAAPRGTFRGSNLSARGCPKGNEGLGGDPVSACRPAARPVPARGG